jgi:hypothetical protein
MKRDNLIREIEIMRLYKKKKRVVGIVQFHNGLSSRNGNEIIIRFRTSRKYRMELFELYHHILRFFNARPQYKIGWKNHEPCRRINCSYCNADKYEDCVCNLRKELRNDKKRAS